MQDDLDETIASFMFYVFTNERKNVSTFSVVTRRHYYYTF